MLRLDNLGKIYKTGKLSVPALSGISINFRSKGMVFILGKSGSGKSTLLNLIAGMDEPTSGHIWFGDTEIGGKGVNLDAYRNSVIGFIFQEFNLNKALNVRENVLLSERLQNRRADKKKAESVLNSVGLAGKGGKKINELSGGEQQRTAIARALIKNPKVILADEPTGNLDENNGWIVFDLLKKLSEERLVIVVSHDRPSAEKYADRIIELSDGAVLSDAVRNPRFTGKASQDEENIYLQEGKPLSYDDIRTLNKSPRKPVAVSSETRFVEKGNPKPAVSHVSIPKRTKGLKASNVMFLGLKNLLSRKLKTLITVLICTITFATFGLSIVVTGYDSNQALARTYLKSGQDDITLFRGNGYGAKSYGPISAESAGYLKDNYSDGFLEIYMLHGYDFPEELAANNVAGVPNSITGVFEMTEEELETLDFKLMDFQNVQHIVDINDPEVRAGIPEIREIPELQGNPWIWLLPDNETIYEWLVEEGQDTVTYNSRFPSTGIPVGEEGAGPAEIEIPGLGTEVIEPGVLNEVVITDFLAYVILKQLSDILMPYYDIGLPSGGEELRNFLDKGFEGCLAYYFNTFNRYLGFSNLRITGILDTGWKDKYLNFIETGTTSTSPEYVRFAYMIENFYLMFYSAEGFARHAYTDSIKLTEEQYVTDTNDIFTDYLSGGKVSFAAGYSFSGTLAEDEVIMTDNMFMSSFGFRYDTASGVYEFSAQSGMVEFLNYKVVGTIDNSVNNFGRDFGTVVSGGTFDRIAETLSFLVGVRFKVTPGQVYDLFNYIPAQGLIYASVYSRVTLNATPTINSMKNVFIPIAVIVAVIATVALAMFLTTAVTKKQKDIGVLKALGAKTSDVTKIYLIESAVTLLLIIIFAAIATVGFFAVADFVLSTSMKRFVNSDFIDYITILYMTPLPFIINTVAIILIGIISIIYPVRRIASMNPADAIKKV